MSEALLADFRAWLAAGGEPAPEPLDLAAVVREFTALRHDVQLQTKATRTAVEKLGTPPDVREVQRPLVVALADIADALATALKQVDHAIGLTDVLPLAPRPAAGWLGGRRLAAWADDAVHQVEAFTGLLVPRLRGVADGYRLSLKRVERALTAAGLEPIPAVGERFDPQTMEAVELADGGEAANGTVLSESRRGYRWHGEVFRFARVTVAR